MTPLRVRCVIVLAAVAGNAAQLLSYLPSSPSPSLTRLLILLCLSDALAWLVIFEYLRRKQPHISGWQWPVYVVKAWIVRVMFSMPTTVWAVASGNMLDELSLATSPPWWSAPIGLAFTVSLFVVSYRYASSGAGAFEWRRGGPARSAIAYGGIEMSPSKTDTTRLLGAAAVLNGTWFRRRVLERLRDRNRSVLPELGLDVKLIAQVCLAEERRGLIYEWAFVGLALFALLLSLVWSPTGIAVGVLGSGLLYFCREYQRQYSLASYFARGKYDPDTVRRRFPAVLDSEIESSIPAAEQQLVVYRGFTPFGCAGVNLGGWSFVLNLDKPKQGPAPLSPESFQTEDLYREVDRSLNELSLDGLVSQDVYFVNGADIRRDRDILPDEFGRPVSRLPEDVARRYVNDSDARVRHYRWYRVHDWSNELIVSQFFRCARRGRSMFVEVNRYLLTPLADQFRTVDSIASPRLTRTTGLGLFSIVAGPFGIAESALRLASRFNHFIEVLFDTRHRRRRREISDNPSYDYGSSTPLRHEVGSDRFVHYFQKVDGDSYSKLFDREVLDALCRFLDAHNIDTSDIRERQNVIMNSGIIVQGGDVRTESLAVGVGATSSKNVRESSPRRTSMEKAA